MFISILELSLSLVELALYNHFHTHVQVSLYTLFYDVIKYKSQSLENYVTKHDSQSLEIFHIKHILISLVLQFPTRSGKTFSPRGTDIVNTTVLTSFEF